MSEKEEDRILGAGRFLRLLCRDGWEFVERVNASAVVAVVAVTAEGNLLLTEQYRPPVAARVVDWPAGLAGDDAGAAGEEPVEAALRELQEETGYRASSLQPIFRGPSSAGLTSEIVTFFRAEGLHKVGEGGGEEGEEITVREVPLDQVSQWMRDTEKRGVLIDPKIPAGLFLLGYCPADKGDGEFSGGQTFNPQTPL